MKNHRFLRLISLLMFSMFFLVLTHDAKADYQGQLRSFIDTKSGTEVTQTPIPQYPASPIESEIPTDRTLPPVGNNAAMIWGASILVLIIIGGVMIFSRRKSKH
jgi:hypothetical protein